MIAIALADDHQVVTHSLKAYLESFADLKVVGIAATERSSSGTSTSGSPTWCFRTC